MPRVEVDVSHRRRFFWIAAGAFVALLVVAGFVVPRLLDVETHHAAIEQALASATGRRVAVGALKLHLLPLPELAAAGLTVGEDPRFGTEPFLRSEQLEVRVRLLPLLRRQVSVVSVMIDRPHLRLERDREGSWNVLSLGASTATAPADTATRHSTSGAGGAEGTETESSAAAGKVGGLSFSADRISIRGGQVTVVDHAFTKGKTLTAVAKNFECTITDLSHVSSVGVDLSFDLEGVGRAGLQGRVGPLSSDGGGTLPFDLTLGLAKGGASLAGKLTAVRERPAIDARLATKQVALGELAPVLRLLGPLLPAGLAMKGEIALDATARGALDDPYKMAIEGTATVTGLELADPALRTPVTAIRGSLALRGNQVEITGFGAQLGKSSVTGACTVTRFERPVIDVRLDSPLLDVDDLLSLLAAEPAAAPNAPTAPPARGTPASVPAPASAPAAASGGAQAPSAIREVTIRGEVAVAAAKVMNLKLSNAKAKLELAGGTAKLGGVSVELYGGKMTGELTARVAEPGPPFTLSGHLAGVAFEPLAKDFSKDLAGLLTGTLETTLDVRGRGLDSTALSRDLTGRASLALRDGKLTSISILATVAKALEAAGGRGIGREDTPFRSLTGTFDIAQGKATTTDLALDSPDIELRGKGWVGLDLALALDVAASFSPAVSADMVAKTGALKYLENRQGRLELDLALAGNLSSPRVALDRQMIDRAAKAALKDKAVEKGTSLLEKLFDRRKKG